MQIVRGVDTDHLTREQAIALVGEAAVVEVEEDGCEPTGRVGYNGQCQGDDLREWSASVSCEDSDGYECSLRAFYYTTNDDDDAIADADGDGSAIDWVIDHYRVS